MGWVDCADFTALGTQPVIYALDIMGNYCNYCVLHLGVASSQEARPALGRQVRVFHGKVRGTCLATVLTNKQIGFGCCEATKI